MYPKRVTVPIRRNADTGATSLLVSFDGPSWVDMPVLATPPSCPSRSGKIPAPRFSPRPRFPRAPVRIFPHHTTRQCGGITLEDLMQTLWGGSEARRSEVFLRARLGCSPAGAYRATFEYVKHRSNRLEKNPAKRNDNVQRTHGFCDRSRRVGLFQRPVDREVKKAAWSSM
jgi:hypothetical protein